MANESKSYRRKGIGGSDIAPICGLSPWKSPLQVYLEKTGESEGQTQTPAMSYGLMMEPVIRQWYEAETGRSVVVPELLVHPKYPFVIGSLDGIADKCRVWEGKTARSSQDWGEPGSDEIPVYYMFQVQWYMMITAYPVTDVTVSFAGSMPVNYEVPADKELQELILEKAVDFWEMVEKRKAPNPIGFSDAITLFGSKSQAGQVTASRDEEIAYARLKAISREMKDLEVEAEKLKGEIMLALEEKDTLVDLAGKPLVTWKAAKPGTMFDVKRFEIDQPDLYAAYLKPKANSRRFLIK